MLNARCRATARPESVHAITVAAGCPWAISLARFGPDNTAICAGSTPLTWAITWLIRISEPSSMPLARLTRVAPGSISGVHCSRLARSFCDGTASNTVVTPSSASAASVVACTPGGSTTSARYSRLVRSVLISLATSGRRAQIRTSLPASASTLASAVPQAPAPITAAVPTVLAISPS